MPSSREGAAAVGAGWLAGRGLCGTPDLRDAGFFAAVAADAEAGTGADAASGDYGHPYGFAPLRERIAEQLD
ncbi:hypothetical protein ACFQBP_12210, partial [Paraburkholderia dipogonis]